MNDPADQPSGPQLTITPEVSLGQYANFVSIAHNFSEVVLDFGRTLPGRTDIPVISRLLMTPFHAKQLLHALATNLQMYERTFGPVAEPQAPAAPPATDDGAN